jgi:1-acyl-sn-glycerol-3-phosphate acyltransferase
VSPEAERNYTKEILLPFKFGAVVMTRRTNCKLIPYAITGDYKFRSKNLKITFRPSIEISDLDVDESNKLLFDTVKKLLIKERTDG